MNATISAEYFMGIEEGRDCLKKHGTANFSVQERIDNITSTLKGFSRNSPVGQMLLGELDFWTHQKKKAGK